MIVARGILLALTAASLATPTPTPTCATTGACANLRLASCKDVNVTTPVTHLDFSSNALYRLEVDCLPSTTLLKVNFSGNNLETIDADLFKQQLRLVYVDLSHNFIVSVPPLTFTSTNLTRLNLASNRLTSIPSLTAANLRVLDLSDNLIARVTDPDTFTSMRRLEALYLTGNEIDKIDVVVFKAIPHVGLQVCRSAATATLQDVLANLTLVECASPATSHHLLFLIGISTLVSCVCALLVVSTICLVVRMPRQQSPRAVEMHALTPAPKTPGFPPQREEPGRVICPDNDNYERPLPRNEVDMLPMAPPVPDPDTNMASTSATSSSIPNHVYLKILDDSEPSCAAPVPAAHRSLLREMSSRELPPIPGAGGEYEPVEKVDTADKADTTDTREGVPGDGRNSFSEFVQSRAATTRLTAPPVPVRPKWAIE